MRKYTRALIILLAVVLVAGVAVSQQASGQIELPKIDGAHIVFNPSGTHFDSDGHLKIRLDFYPTEASKSYVDHYVLVPDTTDWDGKSDPTLLPKVWQLNPFLSIFVTVPPDVTQDDVIDYLQSVYTADVIATLDDAATQPNSLHLISPYTKDKLNISDPKLSLSGVGEAAAVNAVNAELSGLVLEDSGADGVAIELQPRSIDIGPGATDRSSSYYNTYTFVCEENPANADGTIDTVEIWAVTALAGTKSGTFYAAGGDDFTGRDYEDIGAVSSGSKQTFAGLDIDVVTGDLLGVYKSSGLIEADKSGQPNDMRYYSGDGFGSTQTYNTAVDAAVSIYGTGTESGGATYQPRQSGTTVGPMMF